MALVSPGANVGFANVKRSETRMAVVKSISQNIYFKIRNHVVMGFATLYPILQRLKLRVIVSL
jgi:hypothetical protein